MERLGNRGVDSARLNALFAALADPTRRAILARLASGEASVTELAEPFRVTQPAISKHLRVLERAGLISGTQDAQRRPRRLEPSVLAEVEQWLEPFRKLWQTRYAALDTVLGELGARDRKRARRTRKKEESQ
jgi:DNA-binding transcriptional ArsR family regulator